MRFFITYIIILLFIPVIIRGQESFDHENAFFSATFEYENGNYKKAAELYELLLNKGIETTNIKYNLARTYLEIPGKTEIAIKLLKEAEKTISPEYKLENYIENKAPFKTLLHLGEAYQMTNSFEKAKESYTKFKDHIIKNEKDPEEINRKLKSLSYAQEMLNNPLDINITFLNLQNENVNNFNPAVSGNSKKLVFNSKKKYYKAIYFSEKQNGEWTKPRNITMEVESDGSFQVLSLSYSGDVLYLTKRINNNDFNLYTSKFIEGKWTAVQPIDEINTLKDEKHACESPDGKFLIISSNRGSSIGGYDLFLFSLENGNWDNMQNLGSSINTPYNEDSPFYSPDGSTLYFTSEGHNSMGGYDIFKCRVDKNIFFNEPENPGYPVNTTKDDVFFCPGENRFIGYTNSVISKTKNVNIAKIEEFNASNPRKVLIKGGISTDLDKESKFENIRISLINRATSDTIHHTQPDPSSGLYTFNAPVEKIKIIIEAEGYYKKEHELNPNKSQKEITINTKLQAKPAATYVSEEIFKMSCILFIFDDYGLSKTSTRKLDQLYEFLKKYKTATVTAVGHTDAIGSQKYNTNLSKKRALTVSNYLIKKGIKPVRIETDWKGEMEPVACNNNPDGTDCSEGREFNRRVCFKLHNTPENVSIKYLQSIPANLKIYK